MQDQSYGAVTTPLTGNRALKSDAVQVAVRVRPLSHKESVQGSESCVNVVNTSVLLAEKHFDFDAVFPATTQQEVVYTTLVKPFIDDFFHGYNVTVLAYGQTGSGKTYTMGNDFASGVSPIDCGIIPRVISDLFHRVSTSVSPEHFVIKLSYLEVLNEEIIDLLVKSSPDTTTPLSTGTGLSVRGDGDRGIVVTGLSEHVVNSAGQAEAFLRSGAQVRATASTSMNTRSSRSHAICTLVMEQHKGCSVGGGAETRFSKFHLVDLAGSERVRRTNSDGARFKEGVHINRGLLALGNVINALCKRNRTKSLKAHIPYRDSKLTRLLEDSLGGNSKTLMIACISPADVNYEETLNTVRYAFRTRSIENRAMVNKKRGAEGEVVSLKRQLESVKVQPIEHTADMPVVNDTHGSCSDLRTQLEEQNCKLKEELVHANCVKDKWQNVASELEIKLEGVRKELHMLQTQVAKKKAFKKRKTRESYETMETLFSSSSDEDDNIEGDSDYVDECNSRNNKRRKEVPTSSKKMDVMVLETSETSCCTCHGKCATKACGCKSVNRVCSAACSCDSSKCRNRSSGERIF